MLDKLAEVAGRLIASILGVFTIKKQAETIGADGVIKEHQETANERLKDMQEVSATTTTGLGDRVRDKRRNI
ncbi:MAG: hypothetical protein AAF441_21330 [Pseudomonadota bacterium]